MDVKEMESLLEEALFGRLGLAKSGQPYVVPFCFYYENNRFYLHCGLEGKKLDFLKDNENVCFQVDDAKTIITGPSPCKYNVEYRSVIAYGKMRLESDEDIKQKYLGKLAVRYTKGELPEFTQEQLAEVNLAVLEVTDITGKKYPKS